MNRTDHEDTIKRILHHRVSAIVRTDDQQLARDAMQAAVDGGFRVVEFTLTTPGALELVSEFAAKPDLLVGAGTVLSTHAARDAVNAGARFIVSPVTDAIVIAEATLLNAVSFPGASTPTEMETAHRAGADFVKVFPAPNGGVDFIRAIRGPLPHLRLFPTAGVDADNVADYLRAGCAGCGFVRSLFVPEDMIARNFTAIRQRAEQIIKRVTEWRSKK